MGWKSFGVLGFDLGPSFKVKPWFTGFGELSFQWIQICIGSLMRRSSYLYSHYLTCSRMYFILYLVFLLHIIDSIHPYASFLFFFLSLPFYVNAAADYVCILTTN